MKTTLYSLTLLTFVIFGFVPNSFAQEFVVRQIYFHPNDREPSQAIKAKLDVLVADVQQFYADQMERHGFGRKTFRLETDTLGEPVRHYVKGKSPTAHYDDREINKAHEEIEEHFDMSEHFVYLVFIEGADTAFLGGQVGGNAFPDDSFRGVANVTLSDFHLAPERLHLRAFNTIAHELGHAFGLPHDFRDDRYMMSYGPEESIDRLSFCAAEFLDAHRYFNATHNTFDQVPRVRMLQPSFVSSPSTIRLRFEITHSARLHQAQLLAFSLNQPTVGYVLLDCQSLNGNNTTVEFLTELTPANNHVGIQVIDEHGNFIFQPFPIDIISLVPDSEPISVPDATLAAVLRKELGLALESPITKLDMLGLVTLHINPSAETSGITDLTGLQYATNLKNVYMWDNQIVDLTPLAGLKRLTQLEIVKSKISDVRPLAELTQLRALNLSDNQISDVSPLAGLTQLRSLDLSFNQISDVTLRPLAGLTHLHYLSLRDNNISDITPLAELTNLIALKLGGNRITDLTPLTGLTALGELYLAANQISDVRPLANLTNLTTLDIYLNTISDISPMASLTNLTTLDLSYNTIADVSRLARLTNLQELYLVDNPIKNRKPLLELLRKNPDMKIYLKDDDTPLPVTLSHFRAEQTGAGVLLKWTTESELDNAGFYIYRSETKDGEFKVANPTMIQGSGTTSERSEYTWTDTTAKPNTVYYYRIEDVSHAGVREQLATVRLRGLVSATGKLITTWSDLKSTPTF